MAIEAQEYSQGTVRIVSIIQSNMILNRSRRSIRKNPDG